MEAIRPLIHSIKKDGSFGILNILGLTAGIIMSLLIVWYLRFHISYNSFIPDSGKIYRLISSDRHDGRLSYGNPLPMADAIQSDFPGIGEIAALSQSYAFPVTAGDIKININAALATDNIFSFLSINLLQGSERKALSEPASSVITKSCAQKLFGKNDPVGQTITIRTFAGNKRFTVRGISPDPQVNSDFQAEMYLDWESLNPSDWKDKWWWFGTQVLIKVKNIAQKEDLEAKANTILGNHKAAFINGRYDFKLLPLKKSHFRTDIESPITTPVSSHLLWVLAFVAVFIFIIACVNFVNLVISQSEKSLKETGIRKVLGASGMTLAAEFIRTNFLKAIISMVLAIGFIIIFLTPLQNLIQIHDYNPFSDFFMWIAIVGLVIISGLISGGYPAMMVLKPGPVKLLSGQKVNMDRHKRFRVMLIILQNTIALVLTIVSLFIFKQISFISNHDLGFKMKGLVVLDLSSPDSDPESLKRKANILQQEIIREGGQFGILGIAAMEAVPGAPYRNSFTVFNPENQGTYSAVSVGIDENYADVLQIPVISGQNYQANTAGNNDAILINETFEKKLGWTSIENKQLSLFTKENKLNVIGVFHDINIGSLENAVPPMIFRYKENSYPQYMVFRVSPGFEESALSVIRLEWGKIFGKEPFNSFTVSDSFKFMYGNEYRLLSIIGTFCFVALILLCFGLLAQTAFTIFSRTKEIGIRKVNGARISEIIAMLDSDFLKWIAVAFVLSVPLAYYAVARWLENFAYKTSISWWVFLLGGSMVVTIALLTISWQSWKAATRNPVEALRYE